MIKVFGQTDTDFSSNGDIVLQPTKAKVHKEDNGDYYLDLECGLEYLDYITQGRIVVADTPTGEQAFRINDVQRTGKKIQARCWHVIYDSEMYIAAYFDIDTGVSLQYTLDRINAAFHPTSPFTFTSSLAVPSGRLPANPWIEYGTLFDLISLIALICNAHVVIDNFDISFVASIGEDKGVTVRYGKNIKDISCVEDWSDVATEIYPLGKNYMDDLLVTLTTGQWYDSDYISSTTQYDIPYCKFVAFNQDHIEQGSSSWNTYVHTLVDDLHEQAEAYLGAHCLPLISYTLKANIDRITDIGDAIEVIDERLGLNLMTNVIAYDYDCLTDKYTDVQFGNFRKTAKGMGVKFDKVAYNQSNALFDHKQLMFNDDNTVTWRTTGD